MRHLGAREQVKVTMYPRPQIHHRIQVQRLVPLFQFSSHAIAALRGTPGGSSCPQ